MPNIALGESAISKTRVYEWYKHFQDGCEDVNDDSRRTERNDYEQSSYHN